MVYGITDCPACLRACADLMDHYPDKEYVFVEADFSKTYREQLKKQYNRTTFPIVVKVSGDGEILLGGYDELKTHLSLNSDDKKDACPI